MSFWQLSSKIPPFTYIATAIVQNIFGRGPDQATLVLLLFSAILLSSVYGLGVLLFSSRVGLWAAGLTVLLPGLYRYRVEFLLDYPLTAVVTLTFFCLTLWRNQGLKVQNSSESPPTLGGTRLGRQEFAKLLSLLSLTLGLALMVKQTALLFLVIPLLWLMGDTIRRRYWGRLAQLLGGLCLSVLVWGPWYRINWLLILTSGKRATLDSAIAEGDPPLHSLDAWIYYWKILPYLVSWPLLLVPIVGLIIYGRKKGREKAIHPSTFSAFSWLAVFWIGGYLLCSLNINKDARYILPLLPVLSLVLAYGLTQWQGRWRKSIRWGTVGLASLLMVLNLFPLGGHFLTQILSPRVQHLPYLLGQWPHAQVIEEIIQTSPYLRTTLGVLPSTPEINQHNLNYYGALHNFQVYGRQVGTRNKQLKQDARSLSWFLTKTGEQGSVPEAQAAMVQEIEQGNDFQLHKTWNLPDRSTLKLYHRRQPPIEVEYPSPLPTPHSPLPIKLDRVILPEKAPPGIPVPVTYEWTGSGEQLQSGIVLLTWQLEDGTPQHRWLHDHGIGMGELYALNNKGEAIQVIERMSMLPPADLPTGTYTLAATYLNRKTGESYPISVPRVILNIDSTTVARPAPELDLVTQLRTLAANLPKGPEALESIFEQTGRINQYDPIQDYLVQADIALGYRLKLEPQNLEWAYALALSEVLQKDAKGAIAILKQVVELDAQNPYAYAYLAFVYLYEWRSKEAQNTIEPALALNPNVPELQALSGVAALLQGNIVKAWHLLGKFLVMGDG